MLRIQRLEFTQKKVLQNNVNKSQMCLMDHHLFFIISDRLTARLSWNVSCR